MLLQKKLPQEALLISIVLVAGIDPIIVHRAAEILPPFFIMGVSSALAVFILLIFMTITGEIRQKITLQAVGYCFGVAMFILTAITLIHFGTRSTSGINTALLGQMEMVFTFFVATFLLGERMFASQLLGAASVFLGTIFILYNGVAEFNSGDLIIIGATALLPFGNTFAKKAMQTISPTMVLALRYVFGAVIYLTLSAIFDDIALADLTQEQVTVLIAEVLLVFVFIKILIYKALAIFPLGKLVYVLSSAPAFAMIFAFLFLREIPTLYQIIGCGLAVCGVALILRKPKRVPVD